MSEIKKIMEKRENIQHFSERVPDKKIIDQILINAHNLVPVKNNRWTYNITVYGPEHKEEKKKVALQTMTQIGSANFGPGGPFYNNIELIEEIYNEWLQSMKNVGPNGLPAERKYYQFGFNNQVTAPYLLVYHKRIPNTTESQKEKGFIMNVFEGPDKEYDWYIASSMHGYGVTLLCAEQNIHASFCKCLCVQTALSTPVLDPIKEDKKDIVFLLGIGYKDDTMPYYKNITKPDFNEIVSWK